MLTLSFVLAVFTAIFRGFGHDLFGLGIAWGIAIAVVAMIQLSVALALEYDYDPTSVRALLIAVLYPIGYWLVGGCAALRSPDGRTVPRPARQARGLGHSAPVARGERRLTRRRRAPAEQQLGDLDRVQRGALVRLSQARKRTRPLSSAARSGADAADEHVLRLRRGARRRRLDEPHRRRAPASSSLRLLGRERLLRLDPDRLRRGRRAPARARSSR